MPRKRDRPLIEPGRVTHEYARPEAAALGEQWLGVFAANGFGSSSRQYLWHALCGAPLALAGEDALARYDLQACDEYVVMSNDCKVAFRTDQRPTRSCLSDWFVFPPNLAWTMAFTHEDGWIGPLFAVHPDYQRLNAANLARIEKRREVENAKQRGWA